MVAQNIAFGVIAAVMVGSAIRVVTTRNIVHAALYLVLVLAGVAAQFILLAAEFVAVTQVLVYIGAIIVLFLFGIMLTKTDMAHDADLDNDQRILALIVAVGLLGVVGGTLWDHWRDDEFGEIAPQATANLSDSIFSTYLVPFEVISVLLLAALIGAIVVARRD
jgi:NADH-quinone oxidoreductase subunit J